jgi:diguanylate cyclase (GGDEF)-like protein
MPRSRTIALLGSTILFAATSTAVFLAPSHAPYLFFAFTLVFIWSDFMEDTEIPMIFGVLVPVMTLLYIRELDSAQMRVAVGVEGLGVLLFAFVALTLYRKRLAQAQYRLQVEMTELDQEMRERERDIKFYEKYKENIDSQVKLRQDFSEAAQALSGTMDLQEIRARLLKVLAKNFSESHIELISGVPKDPLEQWAAQQRLPVLVPDIKNDARFRTFHMSYPFRSIMVVPLHALHQPVGFLRIEHGNPDAFQSSDLRTAELYATMASLAMENVRLYEQIQEFAVRDGLTKLYTHRHFQQRLGDEILQAGRTKMPLSMLLCDIDHFKKYNDTFGHQAGDALLRRVAQILQESVREVDYVARYGGEEFALILPATAKTDGARVAEAIRKRVEAEPFVFNGQPSKVTMSFGVSSFPEDATTQSQIIRFADERLYKSKHGGRNQVTHA